MCLHTIGSKRSVNLTDCKREYLLQSGRHCSLLTLQCFECHEKGIMLSCISTFYPIFIYLVVSYLLTMMISQLNILKFAVFVKQPMATKDKALDQPRPHAMTYLQEYLWYI